MYGLPGVRRPGRRARGTHAEGSPAPSWAPGGLAGAGHGALVLIADANYPSSTARGPNAAVVHLNLTPASWTPSRLVAAVAGQSAGRGGHRDGAGASGRQRAGRGPADLARFAGALRTPAVRPLQQLGAAAFYAAAGTPDVALTVVTGETEIYANLLLRVGVVRSP